MIIYNVTVKLEKVIHEEWLNWMKTKHIPDVMATGYFLGNNIFKILVEEDDGVSYSVQYACANMSDLQEYQLKHAPALQKEHIDKFRNQFIAFRTLLEKV